MTRRGFEGSYLGDAASVGPGTRLECKVCWYVYDPAEGDPIWQVPPGTPFTELPPHWACPNCAGDREQFLVLPDEGAAMLLPDPSARLEAAYREVQATRMRGLGFLNPALEVAAVGFTPWEGHWLGIVLSPWFMNLTLAPRDPAAWQPLAPGDKRHYRFPAGEFEFVGAEDPLAGETQVCSLFSPVQEFADQQSALTTARCALEALMDESHAERD